MQNKLGTIGIIPLFSVIILAIGLMNHVLVIPVLLGEAGRDAWFSILAAIPPYLLWVSMLYFIMQRTKQQQILSWLQQHYGIFVTWGFRAFFIVFLFFISAITLKDTIVWTHVSYLPRTPEMVLAISLILLCLLAVHYGMQAIAVTAGILLPFVIIFGDFVMSANLPAKNYSLLTPLFENGYGPVLRGGIYIGGGLVELILILFIQHQFRTKVPLWAIYILAIFLVILIFGPVTGAITEFGPFEAARLRYPAYEEWRLVQIGKYIQHVDFLSIYQWLSGAFIRIAISMFILIDIVTFNRGKPYKLAWLLFLSLMLIIATAIPISDMQFLAFLNRIYFPATLWIVLGLSLILFFMAFTSKKAGVNKNES